MGPVKEFSMIEGADRATRTQISNESGAFLTPSKHVTTGSRDFGSLNRLAEIDALLCTNC